MNLRATINDLRSMDEKDPRVKKIHERTSRAATKGGLRLRIKPSEKRVISIWSDFEPRCELFRREKLESDVRGAMMEGNLPIQRVVDFDANSILRGVRMPTETLKPVVNGAGQFERPLQAAYEQWVLNPGKVIAAIPIWQQMLVGMRPGTRT